MTPEQAAAYVNAQAALFLGELELIKAEGTSIAIDPQTGACTSVCMPDVAQLKTLVEEHRWVLSHNAVLTTFQHANDPGWDRR